jgi:hypothetical protein
MFISAVAWVKAHGDLVDFDCPESAVPALFAEMREKQLISRVPKGTKFRLTPAGQAFLDVHGEAWNGR